MDGQVVDEAVGVPEAVEVVEVDVTDDGFVGEGGVGGAELLAEVGRGVDEEALAGALVLDVDGEARALDTLLPGALAGRTLAADGRGPGGVVRSNASDC